MSPVCTCVSFQLTYADIVVFSILDQLCNSDPDFVNSINDFLALKNFCMRMSQLPNIAQYLLHRKRVSLLQLRHHTPPVAEKLNQQSAERQVAGLQLTQVEQSNKQELTETDTTAGPSKDMTVVDV